MKTLFTFKTLLILVSISFFASCTNMNAPEMSSTFTAISNDGLSTPVSESAIIHADATINAFIKNNGIQKSTKVITNDPDSAEDAVNEGYPKVSCLTEKGKYPSEYVIDYGEKGYITHSKQIYKGQVHYTVSDITCKKKEYKFSNFTINDTKVEYSKTVEVLSKGVLRFITKETTEASNQRSTYKYAERTRTKITPEVSVKVGDGDNDEDDYTNYNYSIDVYIKGINAKGEEYTLKSVEPMVTDCTKKGLAKGIMRVTTKRGTKHLDYSKEGDNKEVEYKEHNDNSENNNAENKSNESENNH